MKRELVPAKKDIIILLINLFALNAILLGISNISYYSFLVKHVSIVMKKINAHHVLISLLYVQNNKGDASNAMKHIN